MRAESGQARQRRREASIDDVARLAGVSGQTVSRVANGRSNVGAATRERVLAAMSELGYRPNSAARALRSGRFRSIGVIVFTLHSYGNLRTLEAVAAAATERRYTITLMPLTRPTHADVDAALDRLVEQAVDGVILLVESHLAGTDGAGLRRGIPLVVVDSWSADRPAVVDTDQFTGARLATEHLLDLGHETVRHVSSWWIREGRAIRTPSTSTGRGPTHRTRASGMIGRTARTSSASWAGNAATSASEGADEACGRCTEPG
ncbi:LacI family DNA-binding transcriptional regulator [Streptomyces atroolivaceus]|uniref:LacI family DNA-binding transcriptional regulator n=1 Tax=Streptomyces atroolivaceus TaxID=66869 RepID=UPI00365E22EA